MFVRYKETSVHAFQHVLGKRSFGALFHTKSLATLHVVVDGWRPLVPDSHSKRSVQAKYERTNYWMTRFCNILNTPSLHRMTIPELFRAATPHHKLVKRQLMAELTNQVYLSYFTLIQQHPHADHALHLRKILKWSARNQQNIKVGIRLLESMQRKSLEFQRL